MKNKIDIYPAIDLKDGKVVRLQKGIMNSAKIYSDNPLSIAKKFENYGASWIHIVDLNGAFKGQPQNKNQIEQIVKNTKLKVQIGGGIRDEQTIKEYINLGVTRVILGSIATQDPQFVKNMAKKYNIALGIDAKNEMVATHGWAKTSDIKALEFAKSFRNSDISSIICTDIAKDGMLEGININFTQNIKLFSKIYTIASGGVKDIDDIKKAKDNNFIDGIIIGKAFYENKLDLKEVFALANY
jgi:phosphoribosylformimino-5-aminoimidazole carboxamide ribotide isomerase